MMDNLDAEPSCALCPQPGANCTAPGATLSRLLLMPGYWRRSNTSIAVLACAAHRRDPASPAHPARSDCTPPHPTPSGATRCPDAHRREHSGCGGGVAPCREGRGLSGVYCTQCPEKQARHTAATLQPPCCTAPLPRQPCPTALRGSPSPLPATSQYVDPLRGACASCDDVRWSAALPALLAALALALAARRLVASSLAVARAAKRAVRRVPLWMRPGLPHWAGTFQSVVYLKIVWCARTLHRTTRGTLHSTLLGKPPSRSPRPETIWSARGPHPLHTRPRARRTFVQIASVFDAVYQVSAPKNTRLFLESIDYDAWGDPYGNWGMGTLLAPPLVPIRSPPRAPPSRHRR